MPRFGFALAAALACCASFPQVHAQDAPVFEVAAIRDLGRMMGAGQVTGPERFDMSGTVKRLVQWAYGVEDYQISGGPEWFESDRYEVVAKADHAADVKELRLMLQALLADRLQFRMHRESKEMSEYALVVSKKGSKLRVAAEAEEKPFQMKGPLALADTIYTLPGGGDMGQLVKILTFELRQPVFDETGLKGKFDFKMTFDPASSVAYASSSRPDDSKPSILDALEQQLGLRLEPRKAPVEVLVVDKVDRPSDN